MTKVNMLKYENNPTIIAFTKVRLPWGWLNNMSAYPVTIFEVCWPTAEHAFQAMRVDEMWWDEIRSTLSPIAAKMLVRKLISEKTDVVVQPRTARDIENMRTVLMQKVIQNPSLAVALLETEERLIIEDVSKRQPSDVFWGMEVIGDYWIGDNMLGLLWMELRARLQGVIQSDNRTL